MNRRCGIRGILLVAVCVASLFGCAPAHYRIHPDFEPRAQKLRTVGLAAPDVRIYALSAGGVQELRDDWSAEGRKAVTGAVMAHFKDRDIAVKLVQPKDAASDMEDLQALYRAVSSSVLDHAYSDTERFPGKMKRFEYTVGSVENVLKGSGAQGLMIIYAFDEISTAGRKTLKALTTPLSLVTGIKPRSGYSAMSAALVDSSGNILWYNIHANEGGYDLRDPGSAASFVDQLLAGLPRWKS